MENYINEIAEICKLPFDEVLHTFKMIWLGRNGLCVTNYKKIIDYSSEKIILKVDKDFLEIGGNSLMISQLNKGEIVIAGKINSIVLGGANEKK